MEPLASAFEAFEECIMKGNGCPDDWACMMLLVNLTRISQLSKAHKVIEAAVEKKVFSVCDDCHFVFSSSVCSF